MNNRELRALLKTAYETEPSPREVRFLSRYGSRRMKLREAVFAELRYMGAAPCAAGIILLAALCRLLPERDPEFIWYVSGTLPVIALAMLSRLGRSERFGMQELEASSRFSVRFVRSVRIMFCGAAAPVIILAVSPLLPALPGQSPASAVCIAAIPYMINSWGILAVTRRWRDTESLAPCLAVTGATCLLPAALEKAVLAGAAPLVFATVLAAAAALAVREGLLYIKESEDMSWNLC